MEEQAQAATNVEWAIREYWDVYGDLGVQDIHEDVAEIIENIDADR
jgi:hypothetical protein